MIGEITHYNSFVWDF